METTVALVTTSSRSLTAAATTTRESVLTEGVGSCTDCMTTCPRTASRSGRKVHIPFKRTGRERTVSPCEVFVYAADIFVSVYNVLFKVSCLYTGSVDVLYGAAAQPGQYGAPQQIRKRSRSGEYHPALTPWQASQYQTLQSQQPQQPQWQTPKGGEAHTSYGYGAPQHAAYSAPRSISLPAQQHQPSRGNLQTTYRGYGKPPFTFVCAK